VTSIEIKAKLRDYICRELIRDPQYPLGNDERLITGGLMDSFALAQLGVFIETAFGVYIPDTDLTVENMETLNRMVKRITQAKPA
jgi:acyl carrier protein